MDALTVALALVCQFSASLCGVVQSVPVQAVAQDAVCPLHAPACADAGHIWYVPAALATHNPALSDADELAVVLAKEGEQVAQWRQAPFSGSTCTQQETAGHQAGDAIWTWLWDGTPPNVVYNPLEVVMASDLGNGLQANVGTTCRTLFG